MFFGTPSPAPAGGGASFGSPAPQPAPAPGAPMPSFTFGSTTANTPAPSGNASAPSGTPAPSFQFGSTAANTPAPTGTSSTGAFGGSSTTAPAPFTGGFSSNASTPAPSNAPTPSAGGLNFGGTSSSTPAPSNGGVGPPNPAPAPGGFSAPNPAPGGSGAPNPAPAPGSFSSSFSSTPTPGGAPAQPPGPKGFEVPAFREAFPNDKIYSDIKDLLAKSNNSTEEGRERASDLVELLKCDGSNASSVGPILTKPKTLQYTGPDNNIRNQLQNNPLVSLPGNVEAILLPEMMKEVASIADDLRISEKDALSLYAEASKVSTRSMLEEKLDECIIDEANPPASPVHLGTNVVKAAKELYFFERQRHLRTILILVQSRIEAPQHPWGNLIIQATDNLLQNNLITNLIELIREWSNIINNIEQELARTEATQANSFSGLPKEKTFHFDQVHLAFALKERHTAAECLFYIAYHTQYTAQEVAALIDLVRDLTNGAKTGRGLPILNPFQDVPSPYEDRPHSDQAWAHFQSSLPPMKEMGQLEWEKQLVKKTCKTSKPELLHCVGALVMTAVSALDAKQVLFDRNTHGENSIGRGNELFPPGGYSTSRLEPIHSKLSLVGCKDWERSDIWGLLAAAYALLLSSSPSLVSSPRQGGASPNRSHGSIEVRRTFRDCLEAPTALKSITFAKLSLLPVLRRPSQYPGTKCDSSEFFLSVLSEFVASFFDILSNSSLPPSRRNWHTEQEEGLQLERENQKQKAEFRLWVGQYDQGPKEDIVPSSVDLLKRPDCLDDMVALAIALADLGSEYALKFWKQVESESEVILAPSSALTKIQKASLDDDSILHFYLAFLGSLAKAEALEVSSNGASVVNNLLSVSSDDKVWNWGYILETLRWYVRQFNDPKTSNTANTGSSGANSTSYYYRNVNLSNNAKHTTQAKSTSKPAELGEANTFYILSLLNLVSNVASKSPASRLQLLSMQLPITAENSTMVVGSDTTLSILFSLATAPLPPEIRGMTFTAIGNLLANDSFSQEESDKIRDFSQNAWELLESCQVLPILLLDQYPQSQGEEVLRNVSGLRFPVSSTSLAGSPSQNQSWVPVDQRYAILYEMEHVESRMGYYSSTEGFLRLLNSLFSNACPPDLGRNWRLRSGCAPYIEYVIHFVLPRATGSIHSMGKLPFRTKGDQARLVSLALEVTESVLVRYSFRIPQNQVDLSFPTSKGALELLRQRALVNRVVVTRTHGEINRDFENTPVRHPEDNAQTEAMGIQNNTVRASDGPVTLSVPAAKSPGFIVLADLLSASDGDIFKTMVLMLDEGVAASSAMGKEVSRLADTYALFGETPPTSTSAKHVGSGDRNPSSLRATLLKALCPYSDSLSYFTAVHWREKGVSHALQILCAAVVREEAFYDIVNAAPSPLRIVPVLRFEARSPYSSQVKSCNAHLLRIKDLLLAKRMVLASIVEYVGYAASSDEHDVLIAMSGLSLIHFVHQSLAAPYSTEALCGNSGHKRLSLSISRRLLASFEYTEFDDHMQVLSLIFDWILSDLRSGGTSGLSYTLLGLPSGEAGHVQGESKLGSYDCFGAILELLSNVNFIIESTTSRFAANSFEILARACDMNRVYDRCSLRKVVYFAERLHSIDFWSKKLQLFLQNRGINKATILESAVVTGNEQVVHSIAWLLKGVASELHLTMGFCPEDNRLNGLIGYLAPKFGECQKLLSLLFGVNGHMLESVILHLPVLRPPMDSTGRLPPQNVIRPAMRSLEGPPEIVTGYEVIDKDALLSSLPAKDKVNAEGYLCWSASWNIAVKMDCAASHLSESLRIIVGIALVCFSKGREQRAEELVTMLACLLNRLSDISSGSVLSAAASRNLCWVVLLLSRVVAAVSADNRIGVADLYNIRDLIARAVVCSGRSISGGEEAICNERTAILSVALLEVMKALPQVEADIDHRLFLDVAVVLAQLSCVVEASQAPQTGRLQGTASTVPSESAIIARSSLMSLIEVWDQDVNLPVDSLAYALLTHSNPRGTNERFTDLLIRLLKSWDEGVVVLLQNLVQIPFVGNLFLDSGLFAALSTVADMYKDEEQRLLSSSAQQNIRDDITLEFPSFLKQHLELLSTLMATSHLLSEDHRRELPENFIAILGRYDSVVERLFADFPSNGDELCSLIQAVAQVSLLSETSSSGISGNTLQPIPCARVPLRGSGCERAILNVSLHIAEHPLPSDRLARLPRSLSKTRETMSSALVEVSERKDSSWWSHDNIVRETSFPPDDFGDWTEVVFERANLGAAILEAGLSLLLKLPLQQDFSCEMSFVRGLLQLSEAAMTIDGQVSTLDRDMPKVGFMEIMDTTSEHDNLAARQRMDLLKQLGKRQGQNALKLLVSLVKRVRSFNQEPENRTIWPKDQKDRYFKAVGDALDITEMESQGIGCTGPDDRELAKQLASALRKELTPLQT